MYRVGYNVAPACKQFIVEFEKTDMENIGNVQYLKYRDEKPATRIKRAEPLAVSETDIIEEVMCGEGS